MSISPAAGQFCPSVHQAGQLKDPPALPGMLIRASNAAGYACSNPVAVPELCGFVVTSAPYTVPPADPSSRLRVPPETETFAELFCGEPVLTPGVIPDAPNHPGCHLLVSSVVPANSSSNTIVYDPAGSHDGLVPPPPPVPAASYAAATPPAATLSPSVQVKFWDDPVSASATAHGQKLEPFVSRNCSACGAGPVKVMVSGFRPETSLNPPNTRPPEPAGAALPVAADVPVPELELAAAGAPAAIPAYSIPAAPMVVLTLVVTVTV